MEQIQFYLNDLSRLLQAVPVATVRQVVDRLLEAYRNDRRLILLGNGGSAATASHLVADFQKMIYLEGGRPFKAMACTDSMPLVTAWANDTDYVNVFAEQVRAWVEADDMVLAISGSGNSPNVLRAVEVAREQGATTIGLSGFAGGKLAALVDIPIVVPCDNMQRIEDLHMILGHMFFWRMMEEVKLRPQAAPQEARRP
jgi:D-sedoheptulose 7-phosphate isomerase